MHVKLVVFDMAGTTVKDNDNVHQFLINAFNEEGFQISRDEANEVMGYPKPQAIKQLLQLKLNGNFKKGIMQYELIQKIHNHFLEGMVDFYENAPEVGEKEGVSETFAKLKEKNIMIVTDTGFDRKIADTILTRLKWKEKGFLDGSVTSDEVAKGRPFPDMIYKAMKIAGVKDAGSVAKVGDTVSDLLQGRRAGCGCVIGITSGAFKEVDLKSVPHDYLINHISEVLQFV